MVIASDQATKIVFSAPSITIIPITGQIEVDDAVQYKPTIIRMPFEKIRGKFKEFHSCSPYLLLFRDCLCINE